MNQEVLKNYAELIVKTGANVQKGQSVVIRASVDDAYFVKYVVEECYKVGACLVDVEWSYDPIRVLDYKYASVDVLSDIPEWKIKKMEYGVEKLPASIYITSEDPDGMAKIDQEKLQAVRKITGPISMKYRMMMDNKFQWTIAGIPGKEWAMKVFPNDSEEKAIEKLWDAILEVSRAKGDAIGNWEVHNKNMHEKSSYLNDLHIKTLKYKSSNGTDFTVDIKECMCFEAGGATTLGGVYYNPNIPTEECFTSPDKYSANGVVYATKPLSVMGILVENFGFRFEAGKIVEIICENEMHKSVLEKLINLDEGASRLGEVALVPFNSPINMTNLIFYSTLYDENACCHLAIGRAFNECIRGFENMSDEEIKAVDLNNSITHVDFMIGSSDLSIVATTYDGREVEIFKDGNWAF